MKNLVKIIGLILLAIICIAGGGLIYLNTAFPKVSEVPELKVVQDSANIARGKYLANHVAVCIDCHSTRDWTTFSAPPVPGTEGKGGERFLKAFGFPGNFYSKNITPAAIGDWSDGELYRTITEGVSKDKQAFFPVMPYPHYGSMDPEDVEAIIAYVRSLPPIENEIPASEPEFPFSFIIKTIPKKATPVRRPEPSNQIEYGGYLVNMAACFDCHTPFEKGKYNESLAYAGGRSFALPTGLVTSPNLTPDKETGIGTWTEEAFIARFKAYADVSKLPKVGPEDMMTVMPWNMYAGMDTVDLKAIYAYLQTLKPMKNQVTRFKPKS
jgi:hypothetical protein